MFRDDIEPERWQDLVDHTVWLRLAKLRASGAPLGHEAQDRLDALSVANPAWQLSTKERDEFSHWMSGTGDPDYEDQRETDRAPRDRRGLVAWLKREKTRGLFYEDNWRETCGERFFVAAYALCDLARDHQWPAGYWREALQAWSDEKLLRRAWRYAAPLVHSMPDEVLLGIAPGVAWWLEAEAKVLDRHEAIFFDLCRRMLALQHQDGMDTDRPVTRAINHPVGHVTQALLHLWFRREPTDNQGLPDDLKPLFSMLCDRQVDQYRHARVLLAAHVITLFRVDREWTEAFLLPLFDWQLSATEAGAAWEGFLWSPRLYRPLLAAFKPSLLETARHYEELGEHRRQYAAFLTYAALDPADTFSTAELHDAISALPPEGLQESAQALVNAQEGAGDQLESYWDNRIVPFWHDVWPKSQRLATAAIADDLARLCIAADSRFPDALKMVRSWLRPIAHPHYVLHLLQESGLCTRFPEEALELLSALVDGHSWVSSECGDCIEAISAARPALASDPRYSRLQEHWRRRGGG